MQLSALDIHHLVKELQILVSSRLDKVYQGKGEEKRDLLFQFHKSAEGKLLVRVLLPEMLYITRQKRAYETIPGHFAQFLRRHVGNARVIKIEQQGFDRIVELLLENKDGQFRLLLELVPPGNALLLNSQGKIVNLLEPKSLGRRVLRGGAVYTPPPERFNTARASRDAIVDQLAGSTKDSIVKALAIDLGLGGMYAEEACTRAGLAKETERPKRPELERLADAVQEMLQMEIGAVRTRGGIHPFPLTNEEVMERFPSLSAAIEAQAPETIVKEAPVKKKRVDVREQQKQALAGFQRSAEENQRKGELLYERYEEFSKLLAHISELRKEHSWKEIQEQLPKRVTVDGATGTVTVELDGTL